MTKGKRNILTGSIITSEQKETKLIKTSAAVIGKGSDMAKTNLKFRAKRKQVNQRLAVALADLAKEQGDSHKQQQNWNTYYCQNTITLSNGRLYGRYCRNRNCEICQDIRRSKIISNYLPILKTWAQPHLVTLTIKSCENEELKDLIKEMFEVFSKIKNKHRKRYLRGKGLEFLGVKSLECRFNIESQTYNPHFHLIVQNKKTGESLISDWLKIWTSTKVDRASQDIKRIKNTEQDLINSLKYICKSNIKTREIENKVYISALDNIYNAIKGRRVYERFGFNIPKTEVKPNSEISVLNDIQIWEYNPSMADWQNERGEPLCEYRHIPS